MRKISVNWVVTKTFSDFKIATTFMLIGSILYLGAMEPREASRAANSHQAKAIQVSCDIIYSIFTTLAILGFTYLSWFEGWKYILCDYLPKFDYKKEGILNSFLCGNILLVCVWLLWLPNVLPLIYCAWALNQWYNDGIPSSAYNYNSDLISYLFSMCIFVYISFFWVYSTLPRHMRRNNGYGSTYAAYYMSIFGLFYIHLIASDDTEASTTISTKNSFETPAPFSDDQTSSDPAENSVPVSSRNSLQIRTHGFLSECLHSGPFAASSLYIQRPCFGSDFTVGALLFALSSLIGSAFSLYDLYDRWPAPPAYVQGLASSFIFTIGAIIFWYASYPHRMQANDCDGSADIRDTFRCLFGGSNKDLDNSDGYTLLGNTSGKSTAA